MARKLKASMMRDPVASEKAAGAEHLKILIFGGTGFVGINIAAALLARGHGVTLFDRAALPRAAHAGFRRLRRVC